MQDKESKEIEEKILDIKGAIENFIQEDEPELSQEDAIKAYKGEKGVNNKKKKKNNTDSDEDADTEYEEYLKKLKKELLDSLERVNILAKKIFDEKSKENLKGIKVKSANQTTNSKEKTIETMRGNIKQDDKERSRE